MKPDSKVMNEEMIRKLTEQTTNVYDSILSNEFDISVIQSPDLSNSIPDNLFDDFQFVNTKFDSGKFENTQHVIDTLDKPQNLLEINPPSESPLLILIAMAILLGLIIFGYLIIQKIYCCTTQ